MTATIPITVVQSLMKFTTYTLKSAFHLNKLVAKCTFDNIPVYSNAGIKKRHRIVTRLSEGFTAAKKRKFAYSKLRHARGDITQAVISKQIQILEANAVVSRPTHRSVELVRSIQPAAKVYIMEHCGFNDQLLATLVENNNLLTD